MKTLISAIVLVASFCTTFARAAATDIGYYGILLGSEKSKLNSDLSKISIHHLSREEHAKAIYENKMASIIFKYKDVCADDSKQLGKGYELVICTFTSDKAKAQKIKGMALVYAGSKLFRIEVSLDAKTSNELETLTKSAAERETSTLNELGKKSPLYSFFPFLYSQNTDSKLQRIFQKDKQLFSIVNEPSANYAVLLDPMILAEHQSKK